MRLADCRQFADALQIPDKVAIPLLFGAPVRHAQQIGGMDRDEAGVAIEIRPASMSRDRKGFAGEGQDRRGAERDDELGVHEFQLLVEPPAIVPDLACRRLLVDAALAALLELEVLDGVGDVDAVPIDAGVRHRPLQELAGGSHEWPALPVFLVARLLADEGDRGADGTFAQDRTRRTRHQRLCCRDHGVERFERLRLDAAYFGYIICPPHVIHLARPAHEGRKGNARGP